MNLPCFYYSTPIVIIDQDTFFLKNLIKNLDATQRYFIYNNPIQGLSFLNSHSSSPTPQEYLHELNEFPDHITEHGICAISIDLANIHKKIYNSERYNVPSVVIVEHEISGMNGIEFCRQLKNSTIKKIMLTNNTNEMIAIHAFNENIIDKFIKKDDPHLFATINNAILELQLKYFFDLSKLIIENIASTTFSLLKNPHYLKFVFDLFHKKNIKEYYLIDPLGSFLLIDINGKISWLIVKSEQEVENDYQIAINQEASIEITTLLADHKKLLFLFSESDYKKPVEKWVSHLHKTHKIKEIDKCYYTLIEGKSANKISGINKKMIQLNF